MNSEQGFSDQSPADFADHAEKKSSITRLQFNLTNPTCHVTHILLGF
jgi:hypothetical protein